MPRSSEGVELSKWYLDCVGTRGDAWVGYHVELRWRALVLRFAGFSALDGTAAPESRLAVRGSTAPGPEGEALGWRCPGLRVQGRWEPMAGRFDATVFEAPEGAVEWQCLQPGARAQVTSRGSSISGFGYAERLRLSLAPWKLPIEGLRWGRFVTAGHALVWIDWEGSHRFRLLAYNGRRVAPGTIGEEAVTSEDGTIGLRLARHAVLRDALLGQTLRRRLPAARVLPDRLLGLSERKWVARGELRVAGAPLASGWALHEHVRWPP